MEDNKCYCHIEHGRFGAYVFESKCPVHGKKMKILKIKGDNNDI